MEKETTICPKCGKDGAIVEPDAKWPHRVLIYCSCYRDGKVAAVRMDRKNLSKKSAPAPVSIKKKKDEGDG